MGSVRREPTGLHTTVAQATPSASAARSKNVAWKARTFFGSFFGSFRSSDKTASCSLGTNSLAIRHSFGEGGTRPRSHGTRLQKRNQMPDWAK